LALILSASKPHWLPFDGKLQTGKCAGTLQLKTGMKAANAFRLSQEAYS
jgi:hypothetical protein